MALDYKFSTKDPIEFYGKRGLPPNAFFKLVSIPFYRYAIHSPVPKIKEVDIFEKAILGIYEIGRRTAGEIAQIMNLDKQLILLVYASLQKKGFLDESENVTAKGMAILKGEAFYTEVDASDINVLYLYQFPLTLALFSRYNKEISIAETIKGEGKHLKLDLGTKGRPWIERPIFCELNALAPRTPNSQEIIRAVFKHQKTKLNLLDKVEHFDLSLEALEKISVVNKHPEKIWLSTCIYIEEEDVVSGEWSVLDPFLGGVNYELKEYLKLIIEEKPLINGLILNALNKGFDRKFDDGYRKQIEFIEKESKNHIDKEFGLTIDITSKLYKYLIKFEATYRKIEKSDRKGTLSKNARVIFEHLFKQMYGEYSSDYQRIANKLVDVVDREGDIAYNKDVIREVFYNLGVKEELPFKLLLLNERHKIRNAVRYYEDSGSLVKMMTTSILACSNNSKHTLFKMLQSKKDLIHIMHNLSEERNKDSDVHDTEEELLKDIMELRKDRAEVYKIVDLFLTKH